MTHSHKIKKNCGRVSEVVETQLSMMKKNDNYLYYANKEPGPIAERDKSFESKDYVLSVPRISLSNLFIKLVTFTTEEKSFSKDEIIKLYLSNIEKNVSAKLSNITSSISEKGTAYLTVIHFLQYLSHRTTMELRNMSQERAVLNFVERVDALETSFMKSEDKDKNSKVIDFILAWIKLYTEMIQSDFSVLDIPHTFAYFQLSMLTGKRIALLNCTRSSHKVVCDIGYEPFAYTLLDVAGSDLFLSFRETLSRAINGSDIINDLPWDSIKGGDRFRSYSETWWKNVLRTSIFAPIDARILNLNTKEHGEEIFDDRVIVLLKGNGDQLSLISPIRGDTSSIYYTSAEFKRLTEEILVTEPLIDFYNREEIVDTPAYVVDRTLRKTSNTWNGIEEMTQRVYGYDLQPFISLVQTNNILLSFTNEYGLDIQLVRLLYELCGRNLTLLKHVTENGKLTIEGEAKKRERMDVVVIESSAVKRKRTEIETKDKPKTLFQASLQALEEAYMLNKGKIAYHFYGVEDDGKDVFYSHTIRSSFTKKPLYHAHILFKWNTPPESEERITSNDSWKNFPKRIEKIQQSYWERGAKIESLIANSTDAALFTKNGFFFFSGTFLPRGHLLDLVGLWVDENKNRRGDPNLLPTHIGDRKMDRKSMKTGDVLDAISISMSNTYIEESPVLRRAQLEARMFTKEGSIDNLLASYVKRTEMYERAINSNIPVGKDIVSVHTERVESFRKFYQTKAGEKPPKTRMEIERERLEAMIEEGDGGTSRGEETETEKDYETAWNPRYVVKRLGDYFVQNKYDPPVFLIPRRITTDLTRYMDKKESFAEIELIPMAPGEKQVSNFIKTPFELWLKRIISGLEYYTVEGRKISGFNVSILIAWSQVHPPWVLNVKSSERGNRWIRLIMADPFNGGRTFYPYIESGPFIFGGEETSKDYAPVRRSRSVFSLPFSADYFVSGTPKQMASYLKRDQKEKTLRKTRGKKALLKALYSEPPANIRRRIKREFIPPAKKTSKLKPVKTKKFFAMLGFSSIRSGMKEMRIDTGIILGFMALNLGALFPSNSLAKTLKNRSLIYRFILYLSSALRVYAKIRFNSGTWWKDLYTRWFNSKEDISTSMEKAKERIMTITKTEGTYQIYGPPKSSKEKRLKRMYNKMVNDPEFIKTISVIRFDEDENERYIILERIRETSPPSDYRREYTQLESLYKRFYMMVKARSKHLKSALNLACPGIEKGDYEIYGVNFKSTKKYPTHKHKDVEIAVTKYYENPELYPMMKEFPRKQTLVEKMEIRTEGNDISFIAWGGNVLSDDTIRGVILSELFESDPEEYYEEKIKIIRSTKDQWRVREFRNVLEQVIMTARYIYQKMRVPFYSANSPTMDDMERPITLKDAFQSIVRGDFVFTSLYERTLTYGGSKILSDENIEEWDDVQMNSNPIWKVKHGLRYHNLTKVPINAAGNNVLSGEIFQSFRRYVKYVNETLFQTYVGSDKRYGWRLMKGVTVENLLDIHLLPKEKKMSDTTRNAIAKRKKTIGSIIFSFLFSGEVYKSIQGTHVKDGDIPMSFERRCEIINKWATFKFPREEGMDEMISEVTHYHPLDTNMFYTPVWANVLHRGEGLTGSSFREHTNSNITSLLRGSDDVNEYPYQRGEYNENPFVQPTRFYLSEMIGYVPACYVIRYTGNPQKGYGCFFDFRTGKSKIPRYRLKKGSSIPERIEREEERVLIGNKPLSYDSILGFEHVAYSIPYSGVFHNWMTLARSNVETQSDKMIKVDPVNYNEYTQKLSGVRITADIWTALIDYKIMLSQEMKATIRFPARSDISHESFVVPFERLGNRNVVVYVSSGGIDAVSFGNETRFFNQGFSNVLDEEDVDEKIIKAQNRMVDMRTKLRKEVNNEKAKLMRIDIGEMENKIDQLKLDRIYVKGIDEEMNNLKDSVTPVIFISATITAAGLKEDITPVPKKGSKKKLELFTYPYIDNEDNLFEYIDEEQNEMLVSKQISERSPGNIRESYIIGGAKQTIEMKLNGNHFLSYLQNYEKDFPRCGMFIQLIKKYRTGMETVWDYGVSYWLLYDIFFTYPPNHFFGVKRRDDVIDLVGEWFERLREEIKRKKMEPPTDISEAELELMEEFEESDIEEHEDIIVRNPVEEEIDPNIERISSEFVEKLKKSRREMTEIRRNIDKQNKELTEEIKEKKRTLYEYVRKTYPGQFNEFQRMMEQYGRVIETSETMDIFEGDVKFQDLIGDFHELETERKKMIEEEAVRRGTIKWFSEELKISNEDMILEKKLERNKEIGRLRALRMDYQMKINRMEKNKKIIETEIRKTSDRNKIEKLEDELDVIERNIQRERTKMKSSLIIKRSEEAIEKMNQEIKELEEKENKK